MLIKAMRVIPIEISYQQTKSPMASCEKIPPLQSSLKLKLNAINASSKVRYIVEQYFGISHLYDQAKRARFTSIAKNKFDGWCRQAAYNIRKGLKILKLATV